MVTVLKAGTRKKVTCPECGALLSYDVSLDVIKKIENVGTRPFSYLAYPRQKEYIICPQCNHEVVVDSLGLAMRKSGEENKEENDDANV